MTAVENPLLEAALSYARHGWLVFPIHTPTGGRAPCSCKKPHCTRVGKHPRTLHGFKDATTSEAQIRAWWHQLPDANVGIATGGGTGLSVLDVDPRNGGDVSLAGQLKEHGDLPETPTVNTGGGGTHAYFASPRDGPSSRSGVLPGLDLKSNGGYIVAPPSLHESGERYVWAWHPDELELASMPTWLLDLARRAPERTEQAAGADGKLGKGGRNDGLCSLAGTMRRRGMSRAVIEAGLLVANQELCDPPLPDAEVCRIAESVARYEPAAVVVGASEFQHHETGNAERFVQQFGARVRFCHVWKRALIWDETRWRRDEHDKALALTKEVVAEIEVECGDDQRWAKRSASLLGRKAMLKLASVEDPIPVSPNELDTLNGALNVQNGTVDLETGKLREHDRGDLFSQLVPVHYDPKATSPVFERFLTRIMPDEEIREFVRRAIGYSLTGQVNEHVLFFAHGNGANGKSTLLGTIQGVLGQDYAHEGAPDLLVARKYAGHPTELAALYRKRFVVCQESGQSCHLDEARVKRLTGGDPITARQMREDFWTFDPTHKLWLSSNHQPRIHGTDEGIWRRILLIPFNEFIAEDERDPKLPQKLREERPGILAWAVSGCIDYMSGGLRPPESVRAATHEYRTEQDSVGLYIEECLEPCPGERVAAGSVYKHFQSWSESRGERPISRTLFGRELAKRGLPKIKDGRNYYLGIKLRSVQ